jgi:hypothetical protein
LHNFFGDSNLFIFAISAAMIIATIFPQYPIMRSVYFAEIGELLKQIWFWFLRKEPADNTNLYLYSKLLI